MARAPVILVLGGPNGAGKTSISRQLLQSTARVLHFVNADVIAKGLSGFDPERAAFAAGRIMIARMRDLANARESFAFESTRASRSFCPWLADRVAEGYCIHLFYSWVQSPAISIRRVANRVREGGHHVPSNVVRRRYFRSVDNLFKLYLPLFERGGTWRVYDNSRAAPATPELVARGGNRPKRLIYIESAWRRLQERFNEAQEFEQDDA